MNRVGQVVIYKLTEDDKEVLRSINRVGGTVNQSDVLPAIVVADWGGCVNLSVVLDGNHSPIWKTSVSEGTGTMQWTIPGKEYDNVSVSE